jgi:hypothetical protein
MKIGDIKSILWQVQSGLVKTLKVFLPDRALE